MDDLFGLVVMVAVIIGILGGLGVIDIDKLTSDPNEVPVAVAPVDVETAAVTPPVATNVVPVVKAKHIYTEPKKATGGDIVNLGELDEELDEKLDELDTETKTEGSFFIDLEAR